MPLFRYEGLRREFVALDLKEMRAQLWQSRVPPPGSAAARDRSWMEVAESQPEEDKEKCSLFSRFFNDCQCTDCRVVTKFP